MYFDGDEIFDFNGKSLLRRMKFLKAGTQNFLDDIKRSVLMGRVL